MTVEPTPENGLADPREEQSAEVKNLKAKLKASKLAMRVRQLARNLKNPAVYSQVRSLALYRSVCKGSLSMAPSVTGLVENLISFWEA